MVCPNCNTPFDRNTVFCGNCGMQVAPLRAPGATAAEPVIRSNVDSLQAANEKTIAPNPSTQMTFISPPSRSTPPIEQISRPGAYPPTPPGGLPGYQERKANRHIGRNVFIVVILLLLIGGATAGFIAFARNTSNGTTAKITPVVSTSATATVAFSDSPAGQGTGALKVVSSGLAAPAAGSHYYAWLVDTGAEKILSLGALTVQGRTFTLDFTGNVNLLGAGNELEITQQQDTPSLPDGKIVLSGTFPPLAFIHIRHLLFSFPSTPGKVGLLVGLRGQAQVLTQQATLLKSLTSKGPQAVRCGAQNIINLIEGVHGHAAQPLGVACSLFNVTSAGDGFGLFDSTNANGGYVILASEHAALAANQSDSTDVIKQQAGRVQAAMDNLKKWLTSIDSDASQLTTNPDNTAVIQDIVTLSDHVVNGFDLNDNGQIDPVTGEAGAITAYNQGQLMAQLALAPRGN